MKYVAALAAAAATALSVVAVASAYPSQSLLPALAPNPALWLQLLRDHPLDPKPTHRHGTTVSLYERTASPTILRRQGCRAAQQGRTGIAILDFGKPAYSRGHYGTILFSDRFAANWKITAALLAYAQGYAHCATSPSAFLTIARGTSNYHPAVPSAFTAGQMWAHYTHKLSLLLAAQGLSQHVASAAADDAEPAWDPAFDQTYDFYRGYAAEGAGETLYDYGSLDGGVGAIWKAWQAYYVSGGMRYAQALPEIYNTTMAQQWARLARIVQSRLNGQVQFAGVLTQLTPGCGCSLEPVAAHRVLLRALATAGADETPVPVGGSNMGEY